MPPGRQCEPLPCTGARQHCSADPSKATVPTGLVELLGTVTKGLKELATSGEAWCRNREPWPCQNHRWCCPSSVGGGVSHRVFLSGTHWLASTLGSCLCMKLSASTELGTIFLLQPQHLLRVAVGCSLCDTRIFMSSPMDLVSLYIWPKSAQTFSPYKGKVKGRMFLEHLLPHLCYRESQGCPL